MDIVKVVCGIIFKDDRVLICRRKPGKSLEGYWEFPGGKVEQNETYEECLVRELQEELGLKINVRGLFKSVVHHYHNNAIELISFVCTTDDVEAKLVDHDRIEWVRVEDLLNWELAPADIPIAEKLVEKTSRVFNKEFNELLNSLKSEDEFVGLGNSNAKILFLGKECGAEVGSEIYHGSKKSWQHRAFDYSESYKPTEKNVKNFKHTWQRYQKLYEAILKEIKGINVDKQDKYEITFIENVFTTELSNLPASKTKEAKKLHQFHEKLTERKNTFFKSSFIQSFPIVLILASDNQYIETYPNEVCELFDVKFVETHNYPGKDKIWIHHSKSEKPKLLIHTRQLTNSISVELIENLAKVISDFVKMNSIKVLN